MAAPTPPLPRAASSARLICPLDPCALLCAFRYCASAGIRNPSAPGCYLLRPILHRPPERVVTRARLRAGFPQRRDEEVGVDVHRGREVAAQRDGVTGLGRPGPRCAGTRGVSGGRSRSAGPSGALTSPRRRGRMSPTRGGPGTARGGSRRGGSTSTLPAPHRQSASPHARRNP